MLLDHKSRGISHPLHQCIFDFSTILKNLGFIQIYGSEILTTEEAERWS